MVTTIGELHALRIDKEIEGLADRILGKAVRLKQGRPISLGYIEDRCLVDPEEICVLLAAGAKNYGLNRTKVGSKYFLHDVSYCDHLFVTTTKNEYDWQSSIVNLKVRL